MTKSKKRTFLLSAALLSVVAIGAGAATTGYAANGGDKELIGANKAKELAAKAAAGQAYRAELEKERGIVYYDVDVRSDHREYDVHIDAYTGKTIKIERDDRDDDDGDDDRQASEVNSSTSSPSSSASTAGQAKIGAEQASRIAAERVNGTVVRSKLDKDDGVLRYEIELITSRGEVEVDVHAHTGKVLSVDYDDDDDDDDDDERYDD